MAATYVVEFQECALDLSNDSGCSNEPIVGHFIRNTFVTNKAIRHLDNFGTDALSDGEKNSLIYWWKPIRVVSVEPKDPDYLPFVDEHIAMLNATAAKGGVYMVGDPTSFQFVWHE